MLLQHPNFFGCLEAVERIGEIAHAAGALFVVAVDPISLGLLKRPGDYGADIVVAEGQSLGSPMAFGGPYLGILACREQFVRRMPGRIAGETVDRRPSRSPRRVPVLRVRGCTAAHSLYSASSASVSLVGHQR